MGFRAGRIRSVWTQNRDFQTNLQVLSGSVVRTDARLRNVDNLVRVPPPGLHQFFPLTRNDTKIKYVTLEFRGTLKCIR